MLKIIIFLGIKAAELLSFKLYQLKLLSYIWGDQIVKFGAKSGSKLWRGLLSFCWVEGQGILTCYSIVEGIKRSIGSPGLSVHRRAN